MADYYNIGKVTSSHGIKGEVKVYPLTNIPERFYDLDYVWIFDEQQKPYKYDIEYVKIISKRVIVKLSGIDTKEDAEKLKGVFLKVDSQNALKLEENEYFIKDLIGINVYTDEGNFLGILVKVLTTGANDVYIIKTDDREILIPAIKEVIRKVDIDNKIMVVHLLEGL